MSDVHHPPEIQEQLIRDAASGPQAVVANPVCALFAVVKADGELVRGLGAASSGKTSPGPTTTRPNAPNIPGQYEVTFDRDVSNCTYIATIACGNTSGCTPGVITVVGRESNPKGVFIMTYDIEGVGSDFGFHLIIHCPYVPSINLTIDAHC